MLKYRISCYRNVTSQVYTIKTLNNALFKACPLQLTHVNHGNFTISPFTRLFELFNLFTYFTVTYLNG